MRTCCSHPGRVHEAIALSQQESEIGAQLDAIGGHWCAATLPLQLHELLACPAVTGLQDQLEVLEDHLVSSSAMLNLIDQNYTQSVNLT
jgi:hypothetical protein